MKRDIPIYFSEQELMFLLSSLNGYQEILDERYESVSELCKKTRFEEKRLAFQDDMGVLLVSMYQVDQVKNRLLSHCPPRML